MPFGNKIKKVHPGIKTNLRQAVDDCLVLRKIATEINGKKNLDKIWM